MGWGKHVWHHMELHWCSPTFPATSWKWFTCQLTWLCVPLGSGWGVLYELASLAASFVCHLCLPTCHLICLPTLSALTFYLCLLPHPHILLPFLFLLVCECLCIIICVCTQLFVQCWCMYVPLCICACVFVHKCASLVCVSPVICAHPHSFVLIPVCLHSSLLGPATWCSRIWLFV